MSAGTIEISGFDFALYELDAELPKDLHCVYVFLHVGQRTTRIAYVGRTQDLKERLLAHFNDDERVKCLVEQGTNALGVLKVERHQDRVYIESRLIEEWNPPCNDT